MPHYFTVAEVARLLPALETAMREAVFLKSEQDRAEAELERVVHRVAMLGGSTVNRQHILAQQARREASGNRLKSVVARIEAFGCTIKDLATGLADFLTLYRNEEVLLCCKLGEREIRFWHRVEDGFPGRQPIDADFLANHGPRAQS